MKKRMIKASDLLVHIVMVLLSTAFILYGVLSIVDTSGHGNGALKSNSSRRSAAVSDSEGLPDMDELRDINPDITGWIRLYGTKIDHPVLQGETDMEYVNKDPYGNYSLSGSIFLSVLNKRDYSESYQLLYGHHMENGSMFGDLDKFCEKRFFFNTGNKRCGEHEGYFVSGDDISEISVFALIKTDAYDPEIYKADKSEEEMKELIGYAEDNALYYRDVGDIDHILALSTCDSGYSYGRTVLLCKVGESLDQFTGSVDVGQEIKRKTLTPGNKRGSYAITGLAATLIELYLAFPLHLIKQVGIFRYRLLNALCLFSGIITALIFLVCEDLSGYLTVTDGWTPALLMMLIFTWMIRYTILKKMEKEDNIYKKYRMTIS